MNVLPVLAGLLGIAGLVPAPFAQSDIKSGVFTVAQAERGAAVYAKSCASCHGTDLVSDDAEAPSLTGFSFGLKWADKSLEERFARIKTTMPSGSPGALGDQVYLDVIAHILAVNGYPSGDTELTTASDLGAITIVRLQ